MRNILVIDDDPYAQEFWRSVLEPHGHKVTVVADAKTGLRLYRDRYFHLVVLDLFLPGMGGLAALQEMDPRRTGVPVIAIGGESSQGGHDPRKLGLALGASRAFPRSFEFLTFLEAVEDLTSVCSGKAPGPVSI